jgi:hypothetical protein
VTTLPLPDRPRTPSPDAAPALDNDASRGLSAVPTLEQASDLVIRPSLSVHPDLTVSPVPEQSTRDDAPLEVVDRGSSDAALLAGLTRVAAAVEVLVGLWLALSPWLVGSNGSAALQLSNIVVGLLLVALAALRLSRPATPRGPAVSFALAAWTIVAAFVLSFQNGATGTAPLWSAIACGAALTGAAAWATTEAERAGLHQV